MKRQKRTDNGDVFGLFYNAPGAGYLSDKVMQLLENEGDAVPGQTHCLHCARELVAKHTLKCVTCDLVSYCCVRCRTEDARVGGHDSVCPVLVAVGAVMQLPPQPLTNVIATWEKTREENAISWTSVWDDRGLHDVRALREAWDCSEALSAPLALSAAFASPLCVELLSLLRRNYDKDSPLEIHFLGIERELVDVSSHIWADVFAVVDPAIPVHILGVGPNVVDIGHCKGGERDSDASDRVSISIMRGLYTGDGASDLCVAFNPGLSVRDYDWTEALASITGWFITTCHSLEEADVERSLPSMAMFDLLGQFENPWASLRYYQSGTVSSDVYRKNVVVSIWRRKRGTDDDK
jgi:hypothetical protein